MATHVHTDTCTRTAASLILIKWALCVSGVMDCLAPTPPPLLTHTLTSVVRMCEANVLAVEKAPKPPSSSTNTALTAKAGTRAL